VKKVAPPQRRSQADAVPRTFPLLLLLFAASGCAALIYEIVWFQLLQLVLGSSSISLGVLLGVFMGGMCLGSWWLARVVAVPRHPLRVFAVLEIGIGVMALLLRADLFNAFNTVIFSNRNTTINFTSPTDQTITNPQYNADGTLVQTRLLPNNTGFGAVSSANTLRSVQAQFRFSF
jgi:hypothetical protein